MGTHSRLSRRGFLVGGAVIAGTSAITACTPGESAGPASASASPAAPERPYAATIAFDGVHQPGIDTPSPLLTAFLGLDLRAGTRDEVEAILRLVSDDARRLMAGEPALADTEPENAADPGSLTIGIGLGRPAFRALGIPAP